MKKPANYSKRNQPRQNQSAAYQGRQKQAVHSRIKTFTVQQPKELLPFLLEHLSNLSRNSVKSVLARGQIMVNEQKETAYNYPLQPGQTVSYHMEKVAELPPLVGLTILHEDEDILVIHKEAGLLSIASAQEKEWTAYRQLTAYVRAKHPGNRIFVVHRLDRDTSGVMMFAKSEKIKQTLQNSWQEIVQERTYIALVEGEITKTEGTISSWLKESSTFKVYSSPYSNGGQHAVTHYKVLQGNRGFSLLEVHLETGRKNQIRVHMQDIGHPVTGDKKYGAKTNPLGRLGLHAKVLAFLHPTKGNLIRIESEIPQAFLRPLGK